MAFVELKLKGKLYLNYCAVQKDPPYGCCHQYRALQAFCRCAGLNVLLQTGVSKFLKACASLGLCVEEMQNKPHGLALNLELRVCPVLVDEVGEKVSVPCSKLCFYFSCTLWMLNLL